MSNERFSMRVLVVVVASACAHFAYSGSVMWGFAALSYADWNGWGGPSPGYGICFGFTWNQAGYTLYETWLETAVFATDVRITTSWFNTSDETYVGDHNMAWMQYGDVVDHERVADEGNEYFFSRRKGWTDITSVNTDYDILIPRDGDQIFYLGIGVQRPDGEYIYGWGELQVDAEGKIQLLNSAIDLDGDPITIRYRDEAVPEPSSALLLLAGGALLALRRTR